MDSFNLLTRIGTFYSKISPNDPFWAPLSEGLFKDKDWQRLTKVKKWQRLRKDSNNENYSINGQLKQNQLFTKIDKDLKKLTKINRVWQNVVPLSQDFH